MSAKEIKELRQSGKLEEALLLATKELEEAKAPLIMSVEFVGDQNIPADLTWPKRNLSWVYYEYLKSGVEANDFQCIEKYLTLLKDLELPVGEEMIFDSCAWQIGKYIYLLCKEKDVDYKKIEFLDNIIKYFHFTKPSESYTFLLKAFMKAYKDFVNFSVFANWWDLDNLMPVDYLNTEFNDRKISSTAEQAFNLCSKHILNKWCKWANGISHEQNIHNDSTYNFVDKLEKVTEEHPEYIYLPYYKVKIQLALQKETDVLPTLIPFVRKTQGQFWAWGLLGEVLASDQEKEFSCLCKALLCTAPPEMLTKTKERLVKILISKEMYNEAKTEIEQIIETKQNNGYKISNDLTNWTSQEWYKDAVSERSNHTMYKNHSGSAEEILYHDIPEEKVVVEFVNKHKEILNFVSENKFGFFKYGRQIKDVKIGDLLNVRFKDGDDNGRYLVNTISKTDDESFRSKFYRPITGLVKIREGSSFGFVDDVFIHPDFVTKMNLINGSEVTGFALKTFNKSKNEWGWKYVNS
ncbi:MAG: hypothetical protein KBF92_00920 [Bacteroidia bacterium]|jgi:hypothetical protein|nr:hypothetical protein [Candidatus Brachybacter algidus]MBK8747316.1 hypothetical protein [Candidatus Brachybacter algidus]MBP9922362.1 hypothetical protein [Bacteroidia bacterium]